MKKLAIIALLFAVSLGPLTAQFIGATEVTQILNNIQLLLENVKAAEDAVRQIAALKSMADDITSTVDAVVNQTNALNQSLLNPSYYVDSFNSMADKLHKGDLSGAIDEFNDAYGSEKFQKSFFAARQLSQKYTTLADNLLGKISTTSSLGAAQLQAQLLGESLKQQIRSGEEQVLFLKRQEDRALLEHNKEKRLEKVLFSSPTSTKYTVDPEYAKSFRWVRGSQ